MNTSKLAKSWRLVHDGKQILLFRELTGVTKTSHVLFEAASREECEAEINRLNLTKRTFNP